MFVSGEDILRRSLTVDHQCVTFTNTPAPPQMIRVKAVCEKLAKSAKKPPMKLVIYPPKNTEPSSFRTTSLLQLRCLQIILT